MRQRLVRWLGCRGRLYFGRSVGQPSCSSFRLARHFRDRWSASAGDCARALAVAAGIGCATGRNAPSPSCCALVSGCSCIHHDFVVGDQSTQSSPALCSLHLLSTGSEWSASWPAVWPLALRAYCLLGCSTLGSGCCRSSFSALASLAAAKPESTHCLGWLIRQPSAQPEQAGLWVRVELVQ